MVLPLQQLSSMIFYKSTEKQLSRLRLWINKVDAKPLIVPIIIITIVVFVIEFISSTNLSFLYYFCLVLGLAYGVVKIIRYNLNIYWKLLLLVMYIPIMIYTLIYLTFFLTFIFFGRAL